MKFLRCLILSLSFCVFVCSAESTLPQVYFSPTDRVDEKLIALIDKETKSIHAAVYCLSHRGIAKALIAAQDRGVAIEIIVDPFSMKAGNSVANLNKAKIPLYVWEIKVDPKRRRAPLMHDKFCVFGSGLVWTGSFNFTHLASMSNRENAVVLNDPAVVKQFEDQFQKLKREESRPYREYLAQHKD